MEKVIYALWKDEAASREDFNAHILGHVGPELADLTRAVRICAGRAGLGRNVASVCGNGPTNESPRSGMARHIARGCA